VHHSTGFDLYRFYSLADKGDTYIAYIYLKHTEHFIKHVYAALGLPARELPDDLGETVDDILHAYVGHIAETATDLATNIYHGKVLTLKDAIQLVSQQDPVHLSPSDRVLPFRIARDVILANPGAIAVGACPCRSVAADPCLPPPREACLILGDPFAAFIAEHNPAFRRISQQEAVEVIQAAHERGDVHTAYFKKEMGNRLFAICNCCRCCCIGVRMWNLLEGAVPFLAPSGYLARVDDACDGCGLCADQVCPFGAIRLDDGALRSVVDSVRCMGCGTCEPSCPRGALRLVLDPAKGEPLDLDRLKLAPQRPGDQTS
jgi:ferredoxin